jgi:hypothetical protein
VNFERLQFRALIFSPPFIVSCGTSDLMCGTETGSV